MGTTRGVGGGDGAEHIHGHRVFRGCHRDRSEPNQGGRAHFAESGSRQQPTGIRKLLKGCWDPTGRYFVTCTFGGKSRYETGYRVHTFQGRELQRRSIDSLLRFKWRPRPPVQLSEQKVKEIRKSIKQISAKFEEEDKRELQKVSKVRRREAQAMYLS